jgi:hypothetical protein
LSRACGRPAACSGDIYAAVPRMTPVDAASDVFSFAVVLYEMPANPSAYAFKEGHHTAQHPPGAGPMTNRLPDRANARGGVAIGQAQERKSRVICSCAFRTLAVRRQLSDR